MRAPILTGLFLLAACAQPIPDPSEVIVVSDAPPTLPGELAVGQSQAFFAAYPDNLLQAAIAACSSPGQTPLQPDPDTVRCETLPSPDSAAALILTYDGTVTALPLYIVSFAARADGAGYLVTADNYVTVPQIDGSTREIRLIDQRVAAGMMDLLVSAGGRPVGG